MDEEMQTVGKQDSCLNLVEQTNVILNDIEKKLESILFAIPPSDEAKDCREQSTLTGDLRRLANRIRGISERIDL